jgi:hypothetical protein
MYLKLYWRHQMFKDASAGSWSFAAVTPSRDTLGSGQITVVRSIAHEKEVVKAHDGIARKPRPER